MKVFKVFKKDMCDIFGQKTIKYIGQKTMDIIYSYKYEQNSIEIRDLIMEKITKMININLDIKNYEFCIDDLTSLNDIDSGYVSFKYWFDDYDVYGSIYFHSARPTIRINRYNN